MAVWIALNVFCWTNLHLNVLIVNCSHVYLLLGLKMLTNQKRGDYYGVVSTWSVQRKRELGVHLLYRAMQIFLAEGERQLRPADIRWTIDTVALQKTVLLKHMYTLFTIPKTLTYCYCFINKHQHFVIDWGPATVQLQRNYYFKNSENKQYKPQKISSSNSKFC